ncbi:hypothetical protein JTB14_008389 [Gonioctena quinquepunctata]|nr:hypothetical protein JTB14_008389 [Gonioctena quinquepunctata]
MIRTMERRLAELNSFLVVIFEIIMKNSKGSLVKSTFQDVTNKDELKNEVQKQFFDENSNQSLINLISSNKHDELMQTVMISVGNLVGWPKEQDFEDTIKYYNIKILDMMGNVITHILFAVKNRYKVLSLHTRDFSKIFQGGNSISLRNVWEKVENY